MTTSAPFFTSASAMPRPMPSLPPVTRAFACSSFIVVPPCVCRDRPITAARSCGGSASSAASGACLLHRGGKHHRGHAGRREAGADGALWPRAEGAGEVERRVALDGEVPERGVGAEEELAASREPAEAGGGG